MDAARAAARQACRGHRRAGGLRLVVDTLGFHITATALLLLWSRLLGASWWLALPTSVFATVAIHLAFYKLLKVPLPWGLLESDHLLT